MSPLRGWWLAQRGTAETPDARLPERSVCCAGEWDDILTAAEANAHLPETGPQWQIPAPCLPPTSSPTPSSPGQWINLGGDQGLSGEGMILLLQRTQVERLIRKFQFKLFYNRQDARGQRISEGERW